MRAGRLASMFTAMVALITACGGGPEIDATLVPPSSPATTSPPATTTDPVDSIHPPDLVIEAGAESLSLQPWTYCWTENSQFVCADGMPPDPLPSLTLAPGDDLSFRFPLDWHLQGTLHQGDDMCSAAWEVDIIADGTPVEDLGPAGTYRFEVAGQGIGGDGFWTFELMSEADRPRPGPFVVVDWQPGAGALDPEYLLGASVGNLTAVPDSVSGMVRVTAGEGQTGTTELIPAAIEPDCWNSRIRLEAPATFTGDVVALGPPPYEITIELEVDDVTLTSETFTWPLDWPETTNESRADLS